MWLSFRRPSLWPVANAMLGMMRELFTDKRLPRSLRQPSELVQCCSVEVGEQSGCGGAGTMGNKETV